MQLGISFRQQFETDQIAPVAERPPAIGDVKVHRTEGCEVTRGAVDHRLVGHDFHWRISFQAWRRHRREARSRSRKRRGAGCRDEHSEHNRLDPATRGLSASPGSSWKRWTLTACMWITQKLSSFLAQSVTIWHRVQA